jgi:molecular chaperone DnaJ
MEESTFTVEIPAGVEEGSTLRLAERGSAGQRGGPTGSLFVHLVVTRDPRFERQGDDLHTTVTIGVAQASLGTEVAVATLEGTHPMVIKAGTQHGFVERVRDAGVPHLRGRGRGDLFVHVLVETPTRLSDAEEELLRQFAAARGEQVSVPGAGGEGVFSRIRSAFG